MRALSPLALFACALAACSFVRSFDGFTGGAPSDAGISADGGLGACALDTLWAGGNDNPAVGPYLQAMATTATDVFAVGGRYPGADLTDDNGFLLRIPKARPATGEKIATQLDQPVAVTIGADGSPVVAEEHGARLYEVSSTGAIDVLVSDAGPVKEVTADDAHALWIVSGSGPSTGFGPVGAAPTVDPYANRLVVHGSTVVVARVAGDGGVTVYDRGTPATPRCDVGAGSAVAVAGDGAHMAWSTDAVYVAPFGSCDKRTVLGSGHAQGVGLDGAHVVARFESEVDAWTLDGRLVCRRPLGGDEPIAKGRANQTVVVEGAVTYFVSPVAVYRLTLAAP